MMIIWFEMVLAEQMGMGIELVCFAEACRNAEAVCVNYKYTLQSVLSANKF